MGLPIVHMQRIAPGKFRVYLMMDVNTGYRRINWIKAMEYPNIEVSVEPDTDYDSYDDNIA